MSERARQRHSLGAFWPPLFGVCVHWEGKQKRKRAKMSTRSVPEPVESISLAVHFADYYYDDHHHRHSSSPLAFCGLSACLAGWLSAWPAWPLGHCSRGKCACVPFVCRLDKKGAPSFMAPPVWRPLIYKAKKGAKWSAFVSGVEWRVELS